MIKIIKGLKPTPKAKDLFLSLDKIGLFYDELSDGKVFSYLFLIVLIILISAN